MIVFPQCHPKNPLSLGDDKEGKLVFGPYTVQKATDKPKNLPNHAVTLLVRKTDISVKKMHDEENLYENAETVVCETVWKFCESENFCTNYYKFNEMHTMNEIHVICLVCSNHDLHFSLVRKLIFISSSTC